jgi:hypothetical protein
MHENNLIQRTEKPYMETLHCPFCDAVVLSGDPDNEDGPVPCPHTLFIATDHGFEYRSARFDRIMKIEGVDNADVMKDDDEIASYDEYTDSVCCPDAVKYAVYAPPPSFFGAYFGFAPDGNK